MTTLPIHPMAALFPMLPESELRALADDIKTNGQHEPAVMFDGQILDGRNRIAACELAGVEPRIREIPRCPDPLAFVLSANLHRRHLSESQRAMLAAKVKPMLAERARARQVAHLKQGESVPDPVTPNSEGRGEAAAEAARMFDVGRVSVVSADKVLRHGTPELVTAVERGEVAVSAAAAVSTLPVEEQREVMASGKDAIKAKAKEIRETKAKRETKAAPARHPLLDKLNSAADRDALDRIYGKVAVANLSSDEAETAGEVYRRRLSELRAKAPAPVETPAPPSAPPSEPAPKSAPKQADLFADDSVPVSTQAPASQPAQAVASDEIAALRDENAALRAEVKAYREWAALVQKRIDKAPETIKGTVNLDRVRRLVELAGSPSENEARNAAMLACRYIREHQIRLIALNPLASLDPMDRALVDIQNAMLDAGLAP